MKYLEAPNAIPEYEGTKIFLAGGITSCRDWQEELVDLCQNNECLLINPRRADFDISKKEESEIQIKWEHEMLSIADHVIFWFSHETLQPITLFELGCMLSKNKKMIVGIDPNYQRKMDLEVQIPLKRSDVKIVYSIKEISDYISQVSSNKFPLINRVRSMP